MTVRRKSSFPDFGHLGIEEQKEFSKRSMISQKTSSSSSPNELIALEAKRRLDKFRAQNIT